MNNTARIKQYSKVSISLACLSHEKLKRILANAKPMHEGIGGKFALISIDNTPVFVKKVPLTDLEQLPQHFMSTANFFNLPIGYQYGIWLCWLWSMARACNSCHDNQLGDHRRMCQFPHHVPLEIT